MKEGGVGSQIDCHRKTTLKKLIKIKVVERYNLWGIASIYTGLCFAEYLYRWSINNNIDLARYANGNPIYYSNECVDDDIG